MVTFKYIGRCVAAVAVSFIVGIVLAGCGGKDNKRVSEDAYKSSWSKPGAPPPAGMAGYRPPASASPAPAGN